MQQTQQASSRFMLDDEWSFCDKNQPKKVTSQDLDSATLLEHYSNAFFLITELQLSIEVLVCRARGVVDSRNEKSTVHDKLFDSLSDKLKGCMNSLDRLKLNKNCETKNDKKMTSLTSQSREAKYAELVAEDMRTSTTSSAAPHKNISPVDEQSRVTSAKKRRLSILSEKETQMGLEMHMFSEKEKKNSDENPLLFRSLPQLSLQQPEPLVPKTRSENRLSAPAAPNTKTTNFFNTIASLHQINFIDREQVVALKRHVINKDERVINPLRDYERNKDLQVLIAKISAIIESF